MENKILNNSYDNVEFGTEGMRQTPISVNPMVTDQYDDSMSDNMESVYVYKKLREEMLRLYNESPFISKYGQSVKKIERGDVSDVYYYFKHSLIDLGSYNSVQIFCIIAEFFNLNYKMLYNDIISLEDKISILESLEDTYGLSNEFAKANRLF